MIVRWGLHELPAVLDEIGVHHPYLITTHRWLDLALPVEPIDTWASSPTHEVERVSGLARGADVMLALGGGSAIDLGKAVSGETGLPLVWSRPRTPAPSGRRSTASAISTGRCAAAARAPTRPGSSTSRS